MSLQREFWFLEGFLDTSGRLWRTALPGLPLKIGRHPSCGLVLGSDSVSNLHAELFERDGTVWLRDLGSRNGTYVNRNRLQAPSPLVEGDILHFADREFRLSRHRPHDPGAVSRTGTLETVELTRLLEDKGRVAAELLDKRKLISLFQPIVDLTTSQVIGWEALTRGELDGEPTTAHDLFDAAAAMNLAAGLSRLCRELSIGHAGKLGNPHPLLFVNTHPDELADPAALAISIQALQAMAPDVHLVLEIHEASLAAMPTIHYLDQTLRKPHGIKLAFDDFGVGQSRLLELSELPPDYLKFAMELIRDIDRAPREKFELVRSLVSMTKALGIEPVAEGIETAGELAACRELGFVAAQGFLLGRPTAFDPSDETYAGPTPPL